MSSRSRPKRMRLVSRASQLEGTVEEPFAGGAYVSVTIHNKKYYGAVFDADSLREASESVPPARRIKSEYGDYSGRNGGGAENEEDEEEFQQQHEPEDEDYSNGVRGRSRRKYSSNSSSSSSSSSSQGEIRQSIDPWHIGAHMRRLLVNGTMPEWVPAELVPKPAQNGSSAAGSNAGNRGNRKRVVVIGAGVSGLAAALELKKLNFDVLILEARPRVGGRCHTVNRDGDFGPHGGVDLGASWIHGIDQNPVTELCRQAGLSLFNTGETTTMFDFDGSRVDPDLDDRVLEDHNTFLDAARQRGEVAAREEALEEARGAHAAATKAATPGLAKPQTLPSHVSVASSSSAESAETKLEIVTPADLSLIGRRFEDEGSVFLVHQVAWSPEHSCKVAWYYDASSVGDGDTGTVEHAQREYHYSTVLEVQAWIQKYEQVLIESSTPRETGTAATSADAHALESPDNTAAPNEHQQPWRAKEIQAVKVDHSTDKPMKPVVKGPGSSFGESPPEVNGFREEQVMVLSRHACDLGLGEMLRRLQKDYRTKRRQRLQKRGTGVDCDRGARQNGDKGIKEIHGSGNIATDNVPLDETPPKAKNLVEMNNLHERNSQNDKDMSTVKLGELEDRLLQWHVANIEYSTAADINDLSLRHWDQDDKTAFEGSHCVIREGFGAVVDWLADKVGRSRIRLGFVVGRIEHGYEVVTSKVLMGPSGLGVTIRQVADASCESLPSEIDPSLSSSPLRQPSHSPRTLLRVISSDAATVVDGSGRRRGNRLKPNDVLASVNGIDVRFAKIDDVAAMMRTIEVGESVNLVVLRQKGSGSSSISESLSSPSSPFRKTNAGMASGMQYRRCRVLGGLATGREEEIWADAVVVTVPLGVLKASQAIGVGDVESFSTDSSSRDSMHGRQSDPKAPGTIAFDPPLPRQKRLAIERLGFGLLNKVVLRFPWNFWRSKIGSNDLFFGRAQQLAPGAQPCDRQEHQLFGQGQSCTNMVRNSSKYNCSDRGFGTELRGEFFWFVDLSDITGSPVLVALVPAMAAARLEAEPNGVVIERCVQALRTIFEDNEGEGIQEGKEKEESKGESKAIVVPAPTAQVVTRWASDPFARGSYSYMAKGSAEDDIDTLREDVAGSLFFAGEATSREYQAMVHGAYLSGVDVARRIENVLRPTKRHRDVLATHETGDQNSVTDSNGAPSSSNGRPKVDAISGYYRPPELRSKAIFNRPAPDVQCGFCNRCDNDDERDKAELDFTRANMGPFIGPFVDSETANGIFWAHENCAAYCPEVSQDDDGQWYNVTRAMRRGRKLNCAHCQKRGATVGCLWASCRKSYHGRCAALYTGWDFERADQGKHFYCETHRTAVLSVARNKHGLSSSLAKRKRGGGLAIGETAAIASTTAIPSQHTSGNNEDESVAFALEGNIVTNAPSRLQKDATEVQCGVKVSMNKNSVSLAASKQSVPKEPNAKPILALRHNLLLKPLPGQGKTFRQKALARPPEDITSSASSWLPSATSSSSYVSFSGFSDPLMPGWTIENGRWKPPPEYQNK